MRNNNERLFLDVHVIQTIPPSNINRDDTGSPKTAQFGGVRRARVSSQSWKRAMRLYFNEHGMEGNVGVRTLEIVRYVASKITEIDSSISEEIAMEKAKGVIEIAKIGLKDDRAKALFFLGDIQAKKLAQAAIDDIKDKSEIEKIIQDNPSIDIALFGRMVADNPLLNEDASAQVAHAISTHGIQNEFDFFTAVDDLSPDSTSGAGMLGNVEFNSATLYRYANIALHEFVEQLGSKEAVVNAVKLFVESFANSMPTGKINTFANQTLPQLVLVTIRKDRPITFVNAFETPVKGNDGYVKKSIECLVKENNNTSKFVDEPLASMYVTVEEVEGLGTIGEKKETLRDLLNELNFKLTDAI